MPRLRGGRVAVLLGSGLVGETVVLVDVGGLPGVADPHVADGAGREVAALGNHVVGDLALLRLVLVLQRGSASLVLFPSPHFSPWGMGKIDVRGAQRC